MVMGQYLENFKPLHMSLKLLRKQCDANNGANTVIIVTHNSLIADIADTVVRVKNGKIESVTQNENPKNIDDIKW